METRTAITKSRNLAISWMAAAALASAPLSHATALVAQAPAHPDVALSLSNLAVFQGHYATAEPLYRRSLAIREKTLGPDHPDVVQSLNNLASLLSAQGQYNNAVLALDRSFRSQTTWLLRELPLTSRISVRVGAATADWMLRAQSIDLTHRGLA